MLRGLKSASALAGVEPANEALQPTANPLRELSNAMLCH